MSFGPKETGSNRAADVYTPGHVTTLGFQKIIDAIHLANGDDVQVRCQHHEPDDDVSRNKDRILIMFEGFTDMKEACERGASAVYHKVPGFNVVASDCVGDVRCALMAS